MPLIGPEGKEQMKLIGRFSSIGIEMVVAICIGFFGGRWLDVHFGTNPYLMYIGLVFGILTGFRGLVRIARSTDLDKL